MSSFGAPVLPEPHTVHLYQAALDLPLEVLNSLKRHLSTEEEARAQRFLVEPARCQFVAARGILRAILGRYLNLPAAAILIRTGVYGKPHLPDFPELHFNVSHTKQRVAIAIATQPIGVDLEWINPSIERNAIAERFFSRQERETLRSLMPEQQLAAFFGCWTRKEALLKAVGFGLGIPLDAFDVSIPHEAPRLLNSRDARLNTEDWSLADLAVPAGYAGTVAVRGRLDGVREYLWSSPETGV